MATRSYLTPREKNELVEYIAASGQSYERYLDWCDRHQVTNRWTEKYFATWVQRRRRKVQVQREEYREHVRKQSTYDKERRLFELERDLEMINKSLGFAGKAKPHICSKCQEDHLIPTPEQILKLIDLKRKHIESISKERGEWMRPESVESNEPNARERLRLISTQLLAEAKETKIIDGTIVVASP